MFFGYDMEKFLLLLVVAALLIGPERLPRYAEGLARFTQRAREWLAGARSRVKEEMGDDFDDVEWRKLDPRQYDPRTIVRDALLEADQEDSAEKRKREREEREAARAERKRRREEEAAAAGEDLSAQAQPFMRLGDSQQAPFDPEAT